MAEDKPDEEQCPAEINSVRCCIPAGHRGCHEAWTSKTLQEGRKVDIRWW